MTFRRYAISLPNPNGATRLPRVVGRLCPAFQCQRPFTILHSNDASPAEAGVDDALNVYHICTLGHALPVSTACATGANTQGLVYCDLDVKSVHHSIPIKIAGGRRDDGHRRTQAQ